METSGGNLVIHFGDPVYRGHCDPARVETIKRLTTVDERGRRYFRRSTSDGWRRLRDRDFPELNAAIGRNQGGSFA